LLTTILLCYYVDSQAASGSADVTERELVQDDPVNADDKGSLSDHTTENDTDICPSVCNPSQLGRWKKLRPWLVAKSIDDKVIGVSCKVCQEVQSISKCRSSRIERLSVSQEWLAGVTAKNSKKVNDKVSAHEESKAHKACVDALQRRAKKQIESSAQKAGDVWKKQNEIRITETNKIFRTVYVIAWKQLCFARYRIYVLSSSKMAFPWATCFFTSILQQCCKLFG
jgi:hypothetical protein